MKRSTKIVAAAALIALAYPAASWFAGRQLEQALEQQYAQLASHPALRVVERSYERGVFASTDTLSLEIPLSSVAADGSLQIDEPLRLQVLSRIKHGPLPGLRTLAGATMDSELMVEGEIGEALRASLNGATPLSARTVFGFDGSGRSVLASPAFALELPAGRGEGADDRLQLGFGGFEAEIDFSAGMRSYAMTGSAQSLSMEDAGARVVLSGLAFDAEQQRLFDDEAWLYVGKQQATIAALDVAGKAGAVPGDVGFRLETLRYAVDTPVDGEFVDLKALMGAEVVRVGEADYGPAHYDFSVSHLHGRSFVELWQQLIALGAEPEQFAAQAEEVEEADAVLAPLIEPALALLGHNPAFSIDRLSFNSPHGRAELSAQFSFAGLDPAVLANPLALLASLGVSAELALPQGLLEEFVRSRAEDAAQAELASAQFAAQLGELEAQGYLQRSAGTIRTRIAYNQGQLMMNDKPFGPSAPVGH